MQFAIDLAKNGGTVLLPAGTATWMKTVEIPDNKKLVLKGAGGTQTVITSNLPSAALDLNLSGSRISEIGFILQNNDGSGLAVRGTGWRIDHCRFVNNNDYIIEAVYAYGQGNDVHPVGVVDHAEFINTRVLVVGNLILMAHALWAESLGLGTNNAVFVEDCAFTQIYFGNSIDANYGGRYVFRYNTVIDSYVEAHAVQGNNRAARSWEVYNNTFKQVSRSMWVPAFMRGGTGVFFNNTVFGSWSAPGIALDNRRSCDSLGDGALCDGSSPWDGNLPGEAGYPCRDQIGRSTDQWLWTDVNPCPIQELDPAYCWNNHHGENAVVFFQHGCTESGNHIQENRDYYNNVPRPGYAPYPYPHPLTR